MNDAFLKLLQDGTKTSAPLLDDAYYSGKNVTDLIRPNKSKVAGYSEDKLINYDEAVALWTDVSVKAKIHNGFLDDDGDGIPNAFEQYGFTIRKKSGGTPSIEPWGIRLKGASRYDAATFKGIRKMGNYSTGLPIDITGSEYEVIPEEQLDRSVVYFKTDPARGSSDWDPYRDNDEAVEAPDSAGRINPLSTRKHPGVAAQPELVADIVGFTVTPDVTTTDSQGKSYAEMRQSDFDNRMGRKMPPIESAGRTSFRLPAVRNWLASHLAPVQTALAEEEPAAKDDIVTKAMGLLGKLPYGAIAQTVMGYFQAKPTGKTINTSTATTTNPTAAARLTLRCTVRNVGTDQAKEATGIIVVKQGGKALANAKFEPRNLNADGSASDEIVINGSDGKGIVLNLDDFKSFTAGGGLDIKIDPTSLVSKVKGPTWNGGILASQGDVKWSDYVSDIQDNCATLFIDDGDNGFMRASLAAGGTATVRDAIYWSLGSYQLSGNAYKFKDLRMRKLDGKSWGTVATGVDAMAASGKWRFIFSENDYGDADISDPYNVVLKPNSTVYLFNTDVITAPTIGSASMDIVGGDVPKKEVRAVISTHNGLTPIEAYCLPDATANPASQFKMQDDDKDGVYTYAFPNHQFSGEERILARTVFAGKTYETQRTIAYSPQRFVVEANTESWKMYYRIGTFKPDRKSIDWGDKMNLQGDNRNNSGTEPAIAVRRDGTAVAVFERDGKLRYRVGFFNYNAAPRIIAWGADQEIATGSKPERPAVTVCKDKVYLTYSIDKDWKRWIVYRLGTLNRAGRTVDWGAETYLQGNVKGKAVDKIVGTDPSVSLRGDGLLAGAFVAPDERIYNLLRDVSKNEGTVREQYGRADMDPDGVDDPRGNRPSIALNDRGFALVTLDSDGEIGQLEYRVGTVKEYQGSKYIAWWLMQKLNNPDRGDNDAGGTHTAVALDNDNNAIVVYENWGLKYRVGPITVTRVEPSGYYKGRVDWGDKTTLGGGEAPSLSIVDLY